MFGFVPAKAAAKNGSSNVDPAPVRMSAWPPGPPAVASGDAGIVSVAVVVVLVHAARASTMTATPAQVAGRVMRRP
jgi:hypothetical protein